MNLEIFTVYDAVAKSYLLPFFLPNQGMAIRTFSDCANDKSHAFCKNNTDYVLYKVGIFSDENCRFELFDKPEFLARADSLTKPEVMQT